MKAAILAAGIGNRLKPITDKTPKPLIRVGGRTILERMLGSLVEEGIKDICIVTGHLKEQIKDFAGKEYKGAKIKYLVNPDYRLGSILSLYTAREEFAGEDTLLMDADVIFEHRVLKTLVDSKHENCFLIDKNFEDSGEEMKIASLDKRVVQVARKITREHDEVGEGVGFMKISPACHGQLSNALERRICLNNVCDYEMALDDFVKNAQTGFEDITGMRWTEVDFPEDIAKAESLGLR